MFIPLENVCKEFVMQLAELNGTVPIQMPDIVRWLVSNILALSTHMGLRHSNESKEEHQPLKSAIGIVPHMGPHITLGLM